MGKFLEKTSYIALIGVLTMLCASFAAFGWGAIKSIKAIVLIISSYGSDEFISIALIELVDSFLIATALFIFSVSLYELFIADLALPDWMLAHNLHDLKTKLSGVIILVMAVKFLEHLVEWKDPTGTLLFGAAVAVVSAGLIAMSRLGGKD